ncbi:hypothetical protein PUR71_09690 [Streptomyces sp. SP17BM10]|uniref:hypothetical protein n=1 Tax=Streptomyces sp. SP17BM10 TaxID=3002530 RepID=UPI002E77911D|nr:hypothetical protein [Streptomyces sp. SP17BM10]MEE1783186.1 hypothetical protein [Streptomyces sp. SP17BM10]
MLDIIFIVLWVTNRNRARNAVDPDEREKYAKRAKIFGWLEIANLAFGVLLAILIISSSPR